MVKLTKEFIQQHKTDYGGWTKAQIEALGLKWPPRHGWQERLVGKEISAEAAQRFIDGKNIRRDRSLQKLYDLFL